MRSTPPKTSAQSRAATHGDTAMLYASLEHHHTAPRELPVEAGQGRLPPLPKSWPYLRQTRRATGPGADLARLHAHLVNMNPLILLAHIEEVLLEDGLLMAVTGEERAWEAVLRMAPAHAAELERMLG